MGRRRRGKRANGEGSIYLRSGGRWVAEVTIGYDERGRQRRSQVYGRTQAEVRDKLYELKARLSAGLPPKPEKQTVAQFLNTWLETVCPANVGDKTLRTYRDLAEDHIIPAFGRMELGKLGPQHVQQFVEDLRKKPKAPRKKNQDTEGSADAHAVAVAEPESLSQRTVKEIVSARSNSGRNGRSPPVCLIRKPSCTKRRRRTKPIITAGKKGKRLPAHKLSGASAEFS